MKELVGRHAPSPSLVVPHFVLGAIIWLLVCLLITLNPGAFTAHYFNPVVLSITHLTVLGWITMVIFGALYQLIPVVMEHRLYSETLGKISFYTLGSGAVLLSLSFWNSWFGFWMYLAASLLVISITLFTINILGTAYRSTIRNMARLFISTAVFWLFFTLLAGVALVIHLADPYIPVSHLEVLKLHAHAGMVGWFLLLIIGVTSVLLPMFLVSHGNYKRALWFSYIGINGGLATGIFSLYFSLESALTVSIVLGVSGLVAYASFVFQVFRQRMKRKLDLGMQQSLLAFILLVVPVVLIVLTGIKQPFGGTLSLSLVMVYGSTLLIGFVSSLIQGQSYKTLPFIVWLKVYKHQVGKMDLPFPKELYSGKVAQAQIWIYSIGLAGFLTGLYLRNLILLTLGGSFLLVSAGFFAYNIFKIVLHKPAGILSEKKKRTGEEKIMDLLKKVIDPELMVNIADLGLIYRVEFKESGQWIEIDMTLSSKACPLGDVIMEEVNQVLADEYPDFAINLNLVWQPAWSLDRVSEAGKIMLGTS